MPRSAQLSLALAGLQMLVKYLHDKASSIAANRCPSIKFNGTQEAMLPPHDVFTRATGHLDNDSSPSAWAHDMAHHVAAEPQGMRHHNQQPAAVLSVAAGPRSSTAPGSTAAIGRNTLLLFSRHLVQMLPRLSTCKVVARTNGKEVDFVLDTGASTSAITNCVVRTGCTPLGPHVHATTFA